MASVWPAKNNYATGDVLTAANMNGIGDDLNDLYNSYSRAAGKNGVINGGFDIWQRGTSIAGSTTAFSADRWQSYRGVAGSTFSRQSVNDSTNLPNIQYCARVQRDSGNTSTSSIFLWQNFETVNSIPFAGKTITFSFYARCGADYSRASSGLTVSLNTGTGTDQNGLTGTFTGQVAAISQTATLTTTWQRFSYSATLASTATQIGLGFSFIPTGTAGAADYYEITGVQLELGSSATPFSRAGGTIQGELAACQRYYTRLNADTNYSYFATGSAQNANTLFVSTSLPVPLRVTPASIDLPSLTNFFCEQSATVSVTSLTAVTLGSGGPSKNTLMLQVDKTGGFTSGSFYRFLANNSTSAYVGVSAEL